MHTLSLINCHLKQLFTQAKIQFVTIPGDDKLKRWDFFIENALLGNLKPMYVQAQVVYT